MGNPDAKRLYDDLLSNYNKLVRPVQNTTDPLTVRIKLKLSQLIDVVSILELQTKVREDFTNMAWRRPLLVVMIFVLVGFLISCLLTMFRRLFSTVS